MPLDTLRRQLATSDEDLLDTQAMEDKAKELRASSLDEDEQDSLEMIRSAFVKKGMRIPPRFAAARPSPTAQAKLQANTEEIQRMREKKARPSPTVQARLQANTEEIQRAGEEKAHPSPAARARIQANTEEIPKTIEAQEQNDPWAATDRVLGYRRPLEVPVEAAPIPTATAPLQENAPVPVVSTQPPVTSASPAGPVDSAGTRGFPPSSTEGAGGDTYERDLYLARLGAQTAAGFGSMGAGRNIDMGIADTLGERLKQVQALRAKREEQSLEQARERATWGASNRAALASNLAQWKGDEAKTAALEALAPGADTTKPSDFSRNIVNAVMTKPKVEGVEATTRKTGAQGDVAAATAGAIPEKVDIARGTLEERKRANMAREENQRQAALAKKALDTKANNEVRAAGKDAAAAEKAITRAMETAESAKLGIIANVRDFDALESVAPGFTKGNAPAWLGQGSITAALAVPALNKKAAKLASALELFTASIRNSLFGASLTGNEKKSFDAIVSYGVMMPPDVLAANINRLRSGAAKFAQNHFSAAEELHPDVTARVIRRSALLGPATSEGGVYSDVWRVQAPPTATAPAGMVKIKHSSGRTATVDRATADQMLKDDPANFSEVK